MNAFVRDTVCWGASSTSMDAPHQPWPYSHSETTNIQWRQDDGMGVSQDSSSRDDAMCVEAHCHRWNPVSSQQPGPDAEFENNCPVEWVPLSDDENEDEDVMQESVVQAALPSSSTSTTLLWYHSRIPSASNRFDSLGLHHPTPSSMTVDSTHYDRTNFSTSSSGVQPELSELDITQISPLSGNPLINWHSRPGFSYYTTTMRGDEIETSLGQKRPREGESDMVNGCKRRRRPEWWVAA